MDVSIIIVNYNTFALTCACIKSILAETRNVTYEIIVVDNLSTDKNPEELLMQFPSIHLIRNSVNVGFSKGNNLGIAKAQGKYILLLNSDTVLMNNAVFICKNFLEEHTNVGVVTARLEYPDGEIQHNCQRFPSILYKFFELMRLQKLLPGKWRGRILMGFYFDHNSVAYPDWVWGTFFFFKKGFLNSLPEGKLADQFFMYVEDMQWCLEFKKRGYKIAFEPAARVIHYLGKSGADKSSLMQTNTEVFLKQYYGRPKTAIIKLLDRLLSA